MRLRVKLLLSLILVMIPLISMAQDNTRTKNNSADIYDNLYEIFLQIKKHRSDSLCLPLCDSMRTLAIKQGDKRAIAMSYAHPVHFYMNYGTEEQFNESVSLLMKASEEAELWSYYYHGVSQKSVYLLRKDRVTETIEMAESIMRKAYEENNKNGIFTSHNILVNCYRQLWLYDAGLEQAEKALQAEIGLPDNKFGHSLARMVELYWCKSDYEGGLEVLDKYGHLVENESVNVRLAEYRTQFYYLLDRKEDFLKTYQEVLSLYDTYGESVDSKKQILYVYYLYLTGRQKEAATKAKELSKHGKDLDDFFIKLYKDTGDAEALYRKILNTNAKWREKHNRLYEADLKKYSLELDNHNLKLREQEMLDHNRKVRSYLALVLLFVLLAFAGLLYRLEQRSNKKLQKANALLEEQNKQLEDQLVAIREANDANNAKTIFLFNMSHDIRTPMNAILGFADLLEKKKDNPELVTDYLGKIKSSGQFLLSLINNVLDMARIESGKMELDEDFYDLLSERNNTVELFTDMARRKNITLTYGTNVNHRYVLLDQMKVRQITLNLISNAIKYTQDGGTVTCSFNEVPCEREGYATYVTTVTDTGIGMSQEFAKNVFDLFSRERNTTESRQVGAGLGMSIVKRLVDMMGGNIEMETVQGKGTKFSVTLSHPIVEEPDKYLQKELHREDTTNAVSIQGRRILLAEDNDLNAEIAVAVLEDAGLVVERAENGVQCVRMLSEAAPGYYDAILMDVQMPDMDGYEATRIIRTLPDRDKSGIPVIAMTANAFEEDVRRSKEAGMNGHLSKPVDVVELMRTLSTIIGNKK